MPTLIFITLKCNSNSHDLKSIYLYLTFSANEGRYQTIIFFVTDHGWSCWLEVNKRPIYQIYRRENKRYRIVVDFDIPRNVFPGGVVFGTFDTSQHTHNEIKVYVTTARVKHECLREDKDGKSLK